MSTPKRDVREVPKPIDVQRALAEAVAKLEPLGDGFALIGGVALAVHGVERYTKDVDFAATEEQSAAAERALKDSDPKPLRLGGLSFQTSAGVRVDLVDRRFEYRALFEEAIRESRKSGLVAKAESVEVPVVTLPYLVAMKLIADRPQDEADLHALLAKGELDYARARSIVHQHIGPYAARRLDKIARAADRKDVPPGYENGDS